MDYFVQLIEDQRLCKVVEHNGGGVKTYRTEVAMFRISVHIQRHKRFFDFRILNGMSAKAGSHLLADAVSRITGEKALRRLGKASKDPFHIHKVPVNKEEVAMICVMLEGWGSLNPEATWKIMKQ